MKLFRIIVFCLSLFSLSACQSALFTSLVTASGERMYQDDFTDQSGGWPIDSTAEGAFAYSDGVYQISVVTPYYQFWALSGHAYQDVRVEADTSRLAGPEVNLYGLLCRAIDEVNFYFFVISSDGYYTIGKVKNNESFLLGQEMMAYNAVIARGESVNHLRFDCIGSTLTGYINDEMVALTEDEEFRDGDAGMIAGAFDVGGVDVSFDNFAIYKP